MSTELQSSEDDLRRAQEAFEKWQAEGGDLSTFPALLAMYQDLRDELEVLGALDGMTRREVPEIHQNDRLGDYRLGPEIGRGGMGIIYSAEQVSLGRQVALKILPASLTLNQRALERFRREASITSRLRHPHIVDIHAIGEEKGVHFIAMELVEGLPLDRVIERMREESFGEVSKQCIGDIVEIETLQDPRQASPLPGADSGSSASNKNYIETAARLIVQVARALHHAHSAGVIHRDVKPSNILVRPDGKAVLTDFGLAREEGLPTVSQTGEFAGTPHYVSPEQAMARRVSVDHRTDIFSLGATLYELLTLQRAFDGEHSQEILGKILTKEPQDPSRLNPALAPDLVTVVLKAMEKDPDRRYQTAEEFAEDLQAFVEYRPVRARRAGAVTKGMRWVKREPAKAVAWAVAPLLVAALVAIVFLWGADESFEDSSELGYLALVRGDREEAESLFAEALERDPDSVLARWGLSRVYLQLDRPIAEIENITPSLSEIEASGFGPVFDAITILEENVSFLGYPEWRDSVPLPSLQAAGRRALELLDAARFSSEAPTVLATFARAVAVRAIKDDGLAGEAYGTISQAAMTAQDPALWFFAGWVKELTDPDVALRAYERALELDPTYSPAILHRCMILGDVGVKNLATSECEEAIRGLQSGWQGYANLAAMYYGEGLHEEAIRYAVRAIEINPQMHEAWDTKGTAEAALGKLGEAVVSFQSGADVAPWTECPDLLGDLILALAQTGDLERAAVVAEEAAELHPGDERIWSLTRQVFVAAGQADQFVDLGNRVIEDSPEANTFYPSLQLAELLLGSPPPLQNAEEGLVAAKHAFEQSEDPELDANVLDALAWGYLLSDELEEAAGYRDQANQANEKRPVAGYLGSVEVWQAEFERRRP